MRPDRLFIFTIGLALVVLVALLESGFMAGVVGFLFMLVIIERYRRKNEIQRIHRVNRLHK